MTQETLIEEEKSLLIEDRNACRSLLQLPQKTYNEVQIKVEAIRLIRKKYIQDEEEDTDDEWENYEKYENETKWKYFVSRSIQPVYEIV